MTKLSVDQTLTRAKSYAKKGDIEQAQRLYRTVLTAFPKNKKAQLALEKLKRNAAAAQSDGVNPPFEKLQELALTLKKGKGEDVVAMGRKLLDDYPFSPALWDILGGAYKMLDQLPDAEAAARKAAELDPNSHQIQNNLGVILKSAGKLDAAIKAFKAAIGLKPDYIEAHHQLADACSEHGDLDEAISTYERLLEITPDDINAQVELATAIRENGELDVAIAKYQSILEIDPSHANVYFRMASALKEKGDIEGAISAYQKSLELKPDSPACYAEATALKGFPVDEEMEQRIKAYSAKRDPNDLSQRHLKFALYNIASRFKKHEEAFKWVVEAADVRKKELGYHIQEDYDLFQKIYDRAPSYLKNYQFTHTSSKTPIFIVGMPRSGTTLTEQIVSSHSAVFGAGELTVFPKLALPLIKEKEFSQNHVLRMRVKYLESIEAIADDSPFVVDKMPHNFRLLPMICAALPEAKIIHIYRSPQATCWSNFTSNFRSAALGYSFNLDDVVNYYKVYTSLMAHWASALGDRIYHLNYEELIVDQEAQTRRLMEYLGLEWEDAVLSPHENTKSVRTASAEQVRQPIYKNSSEKWMLYEPYLSTAFKTLEGFKKPG